MGKKKVDDKTKTEMKLDNCFMTIEEIVREKDEEINLLNQQLGSMEAECDKLRAELNRVREIVSQL